MKILFLTLANINSIEDRAIYPDLLRKFRDEGHSIVIISPVERKLNKNTNTNVIYEVGCRILKVWTTNFQKTNIFEKAISTICIEFFFQNAINKFLKKEQFDLILYSTPPITFTRLIRKLKTTTNAYTYLLLKDIFPQNAVDLNLINKNTLVYRYFRKREKELYELSDYIGCMSNANVKYLLDNNPSLNKNNIEVNPNSIYIDEEDLIKNIESNLFNRITLPKDKTIFIYGGNLGKPQGINFLLEVIIESQINPKGFFIIVGSGTEFKYIEKWFNDINPVNAILLSELNQKEYNLLLSKCHVGLVFLHPNFTIPNYPSRILNYMENSLPILFATDKHTDVGSDAENYKYGFWCENGDLIKFVSFVNYCIDNKQVTESMGKNGFERLKNEFNVDNSYRLICKRVNYNI